MKGTKYLRFLFMICLLQSIANANDLQTKIGKVTASTFKKILSPSQQIISVVKAFQNEVKRDCVIMALKTEVPMEVFAEYPVAILTNPEEELESWIREDRHGTHFDTGCNVIVTKTEHLDKDLESKFRNLLWIVLDLKPIPEEIKMDKTLVKLYPKIVSVHCPYIEEPKISLYERVEFCDKLIDMKNKTLDYALLQYTNHYRLDGNGKPSGVMYDHMTVLAKFMNFHANVTAIPGFDDHIKQIENGKSRIGSPQGAGF